MATEIYLGNPPQYVVDWIKAHSKPVGNPKTKITFTDGTSQEYDWSGEINQQTMIDAGLYSGGPIWIKEPQTIEIGTNVMSIGFQAFQFCMALTSVLIPDSVTIIRDGVFYYCQSMGSVTIPDSVTSIGDFAFDGCTGLASMTFSGKDKATVQNMANYSWELKSGCVIHCTDGDITI